jgi:hypothetical protein
MNLTEPRRRRRCPSGVGISIFGNEIFGDVTGSALLRILARYPKKASEPLKVRSRSCKRTRETRWEVDDKSTSPGEMHCYTCPSSRRIYCAAQN